MELGDGMLVTFSCDKSIEISDDSILLKGGWVDRCLRTSVLFPPPHSSTTRVTFVTHVQNGQPN